MKRSGRILLAVMMLAGCGAAGGQSPATQAVGYSQCPASADGIGRVYMGREIAQVMGHLGAGWLERGERENEERTDLLMANLDLKPTDVVADVGAGTGYFTFRMAGRVPQGKVLAVDIQPEMLAMIDAGAKERKAANVQSVLGTTEDPKLPAGGVDVVLLVDAYHEFDHPREMMAAIAASLKPGGRVVLVEYRGEDDAVPIKPHHKMTQEQAKREMAAVGLRHVETREVLPWQHLMVFGRAQTADRPLIFVLEGEPLTFYWGNILQPLPPGTLVEECHNTILPTDDY